MLHKPRRLNLKKDFKFVSAGKKADTKYIKMFIRVGDNLEARVGIALSAKVFSKAHERNRARRLVSSSFETLYHRLPNTINIVALPKISILSVKSGDVLLEVEGKLTDEKIIN